MQLFCYSQQILLENDDLLKEAINSFQKSERNSLATFSVSEKKIGIIENDFFKPTNYCARAKITRFRKIIF